MAGAMRFASAGLELAAATLIFGGLGHLVDRWWGSPVPYGGAAGALFGFALGMIRFIRLAIEVSNDQDRPLPKGGEVARRGDEGSSESADRR